jgi:hypothetical protein
VFNRAKVEALFRQAGFAMLWRDYGSEYFTLPRDREPAVHLSYLLSKARA